nr:hypothetical protein [Geminicoccus flavidas]
MTSITAEELGHVELVTTGVSKVAFGPDGQDAHGDDITDTPFADMKGIRLAATFLSAGGAAKYEQEGSHRRLYTWSPTDYKEIAGIWGEQALPTDPPGELEVARTSRTAAGSPS